MATPATSRDIAPLVAELLSHSLDEADLRLASEHIARPRENLDTLTRSIFIFRLGAEWLGLPLSVVDEVLEPRLIHTLPHRREGVVRGTVNVRGRLSICVALEQLFQHGPPSPPGRHAANIPGARLVVVAMQGHPLAFEADEVHGSHRFDPERLRQVPATVGQAIASFTTDVLPWRDHMVGLLDAELVMHALGRRLG